ncbi:MAG: Arc family DNA binding domain-containing protein [Phycisphaerae bacterium]|nr:MAG: Arc family DNA binding domain-containing protein [Planctomycetota bacterium]KAB2944719.1 MAG: Arc family DNA binding domain-containing protein [Phycisphaerae bacterium]MBE7456777.1 Arc family DNA binding domain-containing protein [Planctomycetia bacterium]MCK6464226.1 Arc family DNA binding domain-containing protein [Phycisphaerae bacterium]MCL4717817.1 Arc family DNA binding domain-containing protein [Phycisphaerae bacterium]
MAERKPFLLRLPPDLMEELNRWARDDLRSVNAQIEYLLREAVRARRRALPPGPAEDPGAACAPAAPAE